MLILIVALVEQSGIPGSETGPRALAIVGILSFSQAGQVSLAIGVGLAELNTTMITGAVVRYLISADRSRTTCLLLLPDLHPWRPTYLPWVKSCT
jgi:hypothetical protein